MPSEDSFKIYFKDELIGIRINETPNFLIKIVDISSILPYSYNGKTYPVNIKITELKIKTSIANDVLRVIL